MSEGILKEWRVLLLTVVAWALFVAGIGYFIGGSFEVSCICLICSTIFFQIQRYIIILKMRVEVQKIRDGVQLD